jgi:hypothetical protein
MDIPGQVANNSKKTSMGYGFTTASGVTEEK